MNETPQKTPVTLITGFLGSGKTTLLQKLLKEKHGKRIAIIENEYSDLGIDHELIHRVDEEIVIVQNGCICCSVRKDFIEAILHLESRKELFDEIVIETTGLADPLPIAQTLLTQPSVQNLVSIDTIITVVDGLHFEANFADQNPEFQAQIAYADLLVLSKADLATPRQLEIASHHLRRLNPLAELIPITKDTADVSAIFGRNLFAEKPMFAQASAPVNRLSFSPEPTLRHPHTQVFSEVFEIPGHMDARRLQAVLQVFLGTFGEQIYRMKGLVQFKDESELTLIQVVRHMISVEKVKLEPASATVNRIVVIAQTDAFKPLLEDFLRYAVDEPAPALT